MIKKGHIVKTLNLTTGEVLTLDKAADRLEFEALPIIRYICPDYHSKECPCFIDCSINHP